MYYVSYILLFLSNNIVVLFTKEIIVKRTSVSDTFTPFKCTTICREYGNTYCGKSSLQCCSMCQCTHGTTYFKSREKQPACVVDPGHVEKCYYHFRGSEYPTQQILSVKLSSGASIRLGIIVTTRTGNKKLKDCAFITNKCFYWNSKDWSPLYYHDDARKSSDFYFSRLKKQTSLMVDIQDVPISLYKGLLIKLQIKCTDDTGDRKESCLMFKVEGERSYSVDGALQTTSVAPAFSHANNHTSVATPNKDPHLITIIVLVSLVVVCVIVAVILIILWRRKKRDVDRLSFIRDSNQQSKKRLVRKNKKHKNDLEYQDPQVYKNGNPTYLEPVDVDGPHDDGVYHDPSKVIFVKSKKEKDPKYDYPHLEISRAQKGKTDPGATSPTKHVYADISTDIPQPNCSVHQYIDPDKCIVSHNNKPPLVAYASIDDNIATESGKKTNTNGYMTLNKVDCNDVKTGKTDSGYAKLDSSSLNNVNEIMNNQSPDVESPKDKRYFELECDHGDI